LQSLNDWQMENRAASLLASLQVGGVYVCRRPRRNRHRIYALSTANLNVCNLPQEYTRQDSDPRLVSAIDQYQL
jgi:hypothetical protein